MERILASDGGGWESPDWRTVLYPDMVGGFGDLVAMVEYQAGYYLFFQAFDSAGQPVLRRKLFQLYDIPVFVLQNSGGNRDYFYTTDPAEKKSYLAKGYDYLGVQFFVGAVAQPNKVELFRWIEPSVPTVRLTIGNTPPPGGNWHG
jgi:hypothetical protein